MENTNNKSTNTMIFFTKTSIKKFLAGTAQLIRKTAKLNAEKQKTARVIQMFGILLLLSVMKVNGGNKSVPGTPGPITGQTNVCAYVGTGQSANYSIEPVPGAEVYLWAVPPTVTIVSGQGTTTIAVIFSTGFIAAANKQLRVKAISSDGNSADRLLYLVAQQPSTPRAISGPSNACLYVGTPTQVAYSTARDANATSYIWGTDRATTLVSHPNGAGINDTVIHVIFKNGYTTQPITVQSANSCGFSVARTLTVSGVAPPTPGIISGPTNACAYMLPNGLAATYSINPVAGASAYTWTTPAGAMVTHPNGSGPTDNSITVQFPANYTSGLISVRAISGCDESAPRSLSVTRLNPSTPGAITPLQKVICPNREYSYTLPSMPFNTSSVNWTVPADAIGFSGQGSTSITVLYPELRLSGVVTATSVSNCASSSTRQLVVNLVRCQLERTAAPGAKGSAEAIGAFQRKTEIGTASEKWEINIAPNPSKGNFNVRVTTADNKTINARLLDLQGRELKKFLLQPGLPFSFGGELKPGTYIMEVSQGKISRTQKLLKL